MALNTCCHVVPRTTVEKAQVKEKPSLANLTPVDVMTAWTAPAVTAPVDHELKPGFAFVQSPPGQLGDFRIPLLV